MRIRFDARVPVAQPDRVFGYEPKGRGFESLQVRQKGTLEIYAFQGFFINTLINGGVLYVNVINYCAY